MKFVPIVAALLMPAPGAAQSVTWGGFVDAYYAYHFNQRAPGDAPLVTQPVRHNEFNVNLAFIEAKLSADRVRGRFAVQLGTAVQANYAGEPTHGVHSGPILSRHIQEAAGGYRLTGNLWVDGGIFLSHVGAESWISRDNWTYTRSLIAEYSPYYETGVKATWSPGRQFTGTLALLNGWQNISETNADKAVGIRLDYAPAQSMSLSYSNFIGNEQTADTTPHTRVFHDFIAKVMFGEHFGMLGSFDVGMQGDQDWHGFTAIARVQATPAIALAVRFERYADPDGVFITTVVGPGIRTSGASLNVDVAPASGLLWRTEARSFFADDEVFANGTGSLTKQSPFIVSSLALTF